MWVTGSSLLPLVPASLTLLLPGCVTVGYDFLKQQATVTVTPSTKGLAK
jgi:hypothetical protein